MILHVITGLGNGGAEALLDTMVRAESGEEHAIVSLRSDDHYGAGLREHGIAVHTLEMPRGRVTPGGVAELFRLIRRYDPRVIQGWMYHANLLCGVLARLAGKNRVVWGLHNDRMDPAGASRSMVITNKLSARTSGFLPRKIVHSSRSGARYHVEIGYDAERMCVVPGGYDISRYRPSAEARGAARAELGIDDATTLIGMVARWHPQKDHANLVEAIAALSPASREHLRVLLVGNETTLENPELAALLERSGLGETFVCLGPRRDVPDLMNALDLHVLSSAFGESFPNVVNEAMASGVPCIVTDVGDAGDIVGDTGWVVPPSDSAALAAAIEGALRARDDAAGWAARRDACRQRVVDNFTIEAMLERYHQIWDAIG